MTKIERIALPRNHRGWLTDEAKAEIRRAAAAGMSVSEICKKYDVSDPAARAVLVRDAAEDAPPPRDNDEDDVEGEPAVDGEPEETEANETQERLDSLETERIEHLELIAALSAENVRLRRALDS